MHIDASETVGVVRVVLPHPSYLVRMSACRGMIHLQELSCEVINCL